MKNDKSCQWPPRHSSWWQKGLVFTFNHSFILFHIIHFQLYSIVLLVASMAAPAILVGVAKRALTKWESKTWQVLFRCQRSDGNQGTPRVSWVLRLLPPPVIEQAVELCTMIMKYAGVLRSQFCCHYNPFYLFLLHDLESKGRTQLKGPSSQKAWILNRK